MFGYIYRSLNKRNGHVYVGQKTSENFNPNYYGSGKKLQEELKLYGKENFDIKIIEKATSKEDLNKREKRLIQEYKDLYANKCINRAKGGEGGNVHAHDTKEEHDAFVAKMTKINRERCRTPEFRAQQSLNVHARYADQSVRDKHAEKVKKTWSDEKLKKEQSERLRKYWKTHTRINDYNYKKCAMELNGEVKEFESRKELKEHLKSEYGVEFPNPKLKQLVDSGEVFKPFHKNKENLKRIAGMRLYDLSEGVETKGDECNPVGQR